MTETVTHTLDRRLWALLLLVVLMVGAYLGIDLLAVTESAEALAPLVEEAAPVVEAEPAAVVEAEPAAVVEETTPAEPVSEPEETP